MNIKNTFKMAIALFAIAGLVFAGSAKAQTAGHDSQNAWRFGIGVEPGIPTGNAHDFSKFSLGGTARLQYDIRGSVSLMLTSGYYNFFGKKVADNSNLKYEDLGVVPVKVGIKAFFAPHVYVSGEAGAGFETKENAYGEKNTKLILSPGIGYAVSGSGLDLGLRYENLSGQNDSYGLVALRIAYGFRL